MAIPLRIGHGEPTVDPRECRFSFLVYSWKRLDPNEQRPILLRWVPSVGDMLLPRLILKNYVLSIYVLSLQNRRIAQRVFGV